MWHALQDLGEVNRFAHTEQMNCVQHCSSVFMRHAPLHSLHAFGQSFPLCGVSAD